MSVVQITIVYVLDASECLPTPEEWPSAWQEQEAWKKAKEAATKQAIRIFYSYLHLALVSPEGSSNASPVMITSFLQSEADSKKDAAARPASADDRKSSKDEPAAVAEDAVKKEDVDDKEVAAKVFRTLPPLCMPFDTHLGLHRALAALSTLCNATQPDIVSGLSNIPSTCVCCSTRKSTVTGRLLSSASQLLVM